MAAFHRKTTSNLPAFSSRRAVAPPLWSSNSTIAIVVRDACTAILRHGILRDLDHLGLPCRTRVPCAQALRRQQCRHWLRVGLGRARGLGALVLDAARQFVLALQSDDGVIERRLDLRVARDLAGLEICALGTGYSTPERTDRAYFTKSGIE